MYLTNLSSLQNLKVIQREQEQQKLKSLQPMKALRKLSRKQTEAMDRKVQRGVAMDTWQAGQPGEAEQGGVSFQAVSGRRQTPLSKEGNQLSPSWDRTGSPVGLHPQPTLHEAEGTPISFIARDNLVINSH